MARQKRDLEREQQASGTTNHEQSQQEAAVRIQQLEKQQYLCLWINILLGILLLFTCVLCYYYSTLSIPSSRIDMECPAVDGQTVIDNRVSGRSENNPSISPNTAFSTPLISSSSCSSCKCSHDWSVMNVTKADLFTPYQKRQEALRLFYKASQFSGEEGEGRQGWLHLLAAYSYDMKKKEIIHNLVSNYEALQYDSIGYSTLLDSPYYLHSQQERNQMMSIERQQRHSVSLERARDSMNKVSELPKDDCTSVMFSTIVSRWQLTNEQLPVDTMNQAIYDYSITQYEKLKEERPDLSATDLNHAFFKVQMADLDTSSSYWGPFKEIPGFEELVAMMRKAASKFLSSYHGWEGIDEKESTINSKWHSESRKTIEKESAANRKASHPLVVWVSVHTEDSVHQPHVTEDALIGGVYYVSVPPGSGKLHMYDPRGKHPLYDLIEPTSPPNPPFHRIVSLSPKESMLVLFPGWLVHSVGKGTIKSKNSSVDSSEKKKKYRVSLSLNLKGEWMDTSSAGFGCPTYV